MEASENIECKFIDRSDKTKEPGKEWANGDGGKTIPEEEYNNTMFGNGAFLPGDFRMENISEDGGERVRNDTVEPE